MRNFIDLLTESADDTEVVRTVTLPLTWKVMPGYDSWTKKHGWITFKSVQLYLGNMMVGGYRSHETLKKINVYLLGNGDRDLRKVDTEEEARAVILEWANDLFPA